MQYSVPLFAITIVLPLVQAGYSAFRASLTHAADSRTERLKLRALTAALHLLQPLARLIGRLRHGLTPWRQRGKTKLAFPWRRDLIIWTETGKTPQQWLETLDAAVRKRGVWVCKGNAYERWDLQVRGGLFASVRALTCVEEHGAGTQLFRLRMWPRCSLPSIALTLLFMVLTAGAFFDQVWVAVATFAGLSLLFTGRIVFECSAAAGKLVRAWNDIEANG